MRFNTTEAAQIVEAGLPASAWVEALLGAEQEHRPAIVADIVSLGGERKVSAVIQQYLRLIDALAAETRWADS